MLVQVEETVVEYGDWQIVHSCASSSHTDSLVNTAILCVNVYLGPVCGSVILVPCKTVVGNEEAAL